MWEVHMEPPIGTIPRYILTRSSASEADLQYLLQQIDIMVSHRKETWERQNQDLKAQLQAREAELIHTRMQVRNLQQQAEERENAQKEMAGGYQERLDWLHSELEKLKDGYNRLTQRRARQEEQGTDVSFESRTLSRKLEEFQKKAKKWEEQRASSQKELALLEANRRSLAARCSQLLQVHQQQPCQESASFPQQPPAGHLPETLDGELAEARAELERAKEEVCAKEVTLKQLKEDMETSRAEREHLLEELELVRTLQQGLERELFELRAALQSRDDLQRATELEVRKWQKDAQRLSGLLQESERRARLGEEGDRGVMLAELLKLKQWVERAQHALQSGDQQEALLALTTLTCLKSYYLMVVQLQDTLQKTEGKLQPQEHCEIQRSHEMAKVPVHTKCPLGSEVAGDPEHSSETRTWPEGHSVITHMDQLSTCWEQTEAGYPPSFSISPATPEDWPCCHGNRQKGEEPAVLGVVNITLDNLDFQNTAEQICSLRSSQVHDFLQEEERRMKTLEHRFDSYVHELHSSTLGTLQRCSLGCPGNGKTFPSSATALASSGSASQVAAEI